MNKNGWGLRIELAFLILFLVCLLIATLGLHSMGLLGNDGGVYQDDGYINDNVNFDYDSLEKEVTSAANEYYKDAYNSDIDDTLIVTVDKLKNEGYLGDVTDSRGRNCKGYSMIMKSGNIVSYIRCSFYKTVGYNEDYE